MKVLMILGDIVEFIDATGKHRHTLYNDAIRGKPMQTLMYSVREFCGLYRAVPLGQEDDTPTIVSVDANLKEGDILAYNHVDALDDGKTHFVSYTDAMGNDGRMQALAEAKPEIQGVYRRLRLVEGTTLDRCMLN